ncbi:MAG: hypothetical protein V1853_01580 [bacterium]
MYLGKKKEGLVGSPKKILSIQEVQTQSRRLRWIQKVSYFLFAHTIGLDGFLAITMMTFANDWEADYWQYLARWQAIRSFLVIVIGFPLILTLILPHRPSIRGREKYQSFARRYHPVMWIFYWLPKLVVTVISWNQFEPIEPVERPSIRLRNRPETVIYYDPDDDEPAA